MTTAITLLLIVGVIVFLSMITPSSTSFLDHTSTDRDPSSTPGRRCV